jgi:hypothetical protein
METTWTLKTGITIDCDLPGGNIILERAEGDTVYISQDLRDTEGHWFYWCFRVRNAGGHTLLFRFTNVDVIGARGPAFSVDGGNRWSWLGLSSVQGASFGFDFSADQNEVFFCMTIPYLEKNLNLFLKRHEGEEHLKREVLCRTNNRKDAEVISIGRPTGNYDHRLVFTARHHCCESLASYTLEGIMDTALGEDALGEWYRDHVEILAVPFMDKDGVEQGDQGKNRRPHDHNRDYGEKGGLYATVRAFKERVSSRVGDNLRIAMDLHCPYIKGGDTNEHIYFVGSRNQENWKKVNIFSEILEDTRRGPLPYAAKNNLPFGHSWNTGSSGILMSNSGWTSELPGILFGTSLEIPYANAEGQEVNAGTARLLGRDIARAIMRYLNPL